jgi:L-idonate 5-dehydrogenase
VQVGTLPAELPFPANSIMAARARLRGVFRADLAFDWAVQAIRSAPRRRAPADQRAAADQRARKSVRTRAGPHRSTKVQVTAG